MLPWWKYERMRAFGKDLKELKARPGLGEVWGPHASQPVTSRHTPGLGQVTLSPSHPQARPWSMIEAGPSLIKCTDHLKQQGGIREYWMSLSLSVDFLPL